MGKTALAMNIAEHVAVQRKKSGRSFQPGNEQPATRPTHALLARARESARVRDGFLAERDFPSLPRPRPSWRKQKFISMTAPA